jgi:hypothetical protein
LKDRSSIRQELTSIGSISQKKEKEAPNKTCLQEVRFLQKKKLQFSPTQIH